MTVTPHPPPSDATHPRVDGACLSDLALDRRVAGERAKADQDREQQQHLDTCPRCRDRLALLEAARAQAEPEIERMLRNALARARTVEPAPAPRSGWLIWGRPALAGAALVAIALAWGVLRQDPAETTGCELPAESIRIKGVSMRFFVQRGDEVAPGVSGDRYREGDALRFVVSSDAPRFLLLVGVEESGRVSAYHPFGGERSQALAPGVDIALPGSLVLDDSSTAEAFVGLFSEAPLEVADVRVAVDEALAASPGLERALETLDLPGQHRWIVVRREGP